MPLWKCVGLSHCFVDVLSDCAAGSGHQSPGLWRHPEDESHRFNDVDHWIELAQLLESAKFHGIFIADVLGEYIQGHCGTIC